MMRAKQCKFYCEIFPSFGGQVSNFNMFVLFLSVNRALIINVHEDMNWDGLFFFP